VVRLEANEATTMKKSIKTTIHRNTMIFSTFFDRLPFFQNSFSAYTLHPKGRSRPGYEHVEASSGTYQRNSFIGLLLGNIHIPSEYGL
jgi:hypothetical protein